MLIWIFGIAAFGSVAACLYVYLVVLALGQRYQIDASDGF